MEVNESASRRREPGSRGPLDGVRIVAVEQYAAGPYGSMQLADLGAEVIKIEDVRDGDVGRSVPPFRTGDHNLFFEALNRGKKSVALDLGSRAGRAVLRDLVAVSDALYYNLRGDVPDKLGLRYADLCDVNPRIVCCSLSGYGLTGPRRASPGYDYMIQGLAGWMSITGEPTGPPVKTGMSAVDFATGLAAVGSLLVGLYSAQRTGRGGDCDVALVDTALSMLNYLCTWTLTEDYQPQRVPQSGHPTLVPFGTFPTADGWIVAGGSKEKFWLRLTEALDRPDLRDDPRYADFGRRLQHRETLLLDLNATFQRRTTEAWLDVLEASGVPCAPVNSVGQALQDTHVRERGLLYSADHPVLGPVGHVAGALNFAGMPPALTRAPYLGEHSEDVLRGVLGYSSERIEELRDTGTVRG